MISARSAFSGYVASWYFARCIAVAGLTPASTSATQSDETVRVVCPATADTSVLSVPRGRAINLGGAEKLTAQSNRHYLALKFDVSKLDGLLVRKATLRMRRADTLLVRVGVSTIAADWAEGTSKEYEPQPGGACYGFAAYARDPRQARWWAGPDSDFSDVVFGNGGARWVPRVAKYDMTSKWYEIDVPPEFVQAIAQGVQPGGLCIADDFGRHETSPMIWSRESSDAPELVVEGIPTAPTDSAPPTDVRAQRDALGVEWVSFSAPRALGFEVYLSTQPLADEAGLPGAKKVDVWAMPAPGKETRRALLSLHRSREYKFVGVRAIEAAGRWSPLVSAPLPAPPRSRRHSSRRDWRVTRCQRHSNARSRWMTVRR